MARETCIADVDKPRLDSLRNRIFDLMADGAWRTLSEIQVVTGGSETGVSAKLRDLRKSAHGGHTVDARRRGAARNGLWEYRLRCMESGQQMLLGIAV